MIALGIFFSYVAFVWLRFGVLTSISASSYALEGNERYLFAGWLIGLAISVWFLDLGVWGHLMAVGFCVAGMSIDHKKSSRLEDEFHVGGTLLAMAAGFAAVGWIPGGVFLVGALTLKLTTRHWIWWSEILAAVVIGLETNVI